MDNLRKRVMVGDSGELPVGKVFTFSYTGSQQSVTLPAGRYNLQVWGAQGGTNAAKSTYSITEKVGGRGGYSEGILTLTQQTTLYVYVGGKGTSSTGGYNGGGSTMGYYEKELSGDTTFVAESIAGGGGGTDIRLTGGAWNNTNSLKSRFIVAGGGSGGAYQYRIKDGSTKNASQEGYVGGGVTGNGWSDDYKGKQDAAGTNGYFGRGGDNTSTSYQYQSAAGGGGWYGGGSYKTNMGVPEGIRYSGGGSGFVNTAENASYRPSGYNGLELDSGTTYNGSTGFPNTGGTGTEFGHRNDGYAKITVLASRRALDDSEFGFSASSITVTDSSDTLPTLYNTHGLSVTYSSTDTSVATIAADGTVTFLNDGSTIIKATFAGNDYYYPKEVSYTLTVDLHFEPVITDYSYKGRVQSATLSKGTYILECWGAKGGDGNTTYKGGYGGYSVGTLVLSSSTTVYIYVGGKGSTSTGSMSVNGGFNGGGTAYTQGSSYKVGSGGGASDIRIGTDSLYARVIVAGGGGGALYHTDGTYLANGGTGGGASGGGGTSVGSYQSGKGGKQTSPGYSYYGSTRDSSSYGTIAAFGVGGGGTTNYMSGGGGGWYGGGYSRRAGSGGGSGYVYDSSTASNYPSGCLLNSDYYLSHAETVDGAHSFPAPAGGTEIGHQDNGYIRITQIA